MNGLAFLARDPERLFRFLTVTGIDIDNLRERAGDPDLLAAVLDFLLAEDSQLLEFAASEQVDAKLVYAARQALPGAFET